MKKTFLKIALFLALTIGANAQNITDAVRWSVTNPGGTARTLGVGGSFGAMGGDFSVININPAGIGEYRKSEFTFSPSLNFSDSRANFAGSSESLTSENSAFAIDNIGLVFTNRPFPSDWVHSNFAIGFSKVADLNNNYKYVGTTEGSITENFAQRANSRNLDGLDDFYAWPAYQVGAIYDEGEDLNYETDFSPEEMVRKSQTIDQAGYINELSFAWGGNYQDKFNVGVSVGVPFVSFEETKEYNESDPTNQNPIFNDLSMTEYINTSGFGFNAKLGFIYKPAKSIRLGGAIHTPSYYILEDSYNNAFSYSYVNNDGVNENLTADSPSGSFKYRLNSPWRMVGSAGTIFNLGKVKGFVNADIEYVDYANAEFDFTRYAEDEASERAYTIQQNGVIRDQLGRALTARIGVELAINKLRLRGGFENAGSPYSDDDNSINSTSFGIGIREDNFFLDAGVRLSSFADGYIPYTLIDPELEPLVERSTETQRVVVTAGFKF